MTRKERSGRGVNRTRRRSEEERKEWKMSKQSREDVRRRRK